jgi:hypothetical protein
MSSSTRRLPHTDAADGGSGSVQTRFPHPTVGPPSDRQPLLDHRQVDPLYSASSPTDVLTASQSSLSLSSSFSSTAPPPLTVSPFHSPWFIYVVSLSAMLVAGSAYSFSSWSPDLKARLSYTQSELELVGYFGLLATLTPSPIHLRVPHRHH